MVQGRVLELLQQLPLVTTSASEGGRRESDRPALHEHLSFPQEATCAMGSQGG